SLGRQEPVCGACETSGLVRRLGPLVPATAPGDPAPRATEADSGLRGAICQIPGEEPHDARTQFRLGCRELRTARAAAEHAAAVSHRVPVHAGTGDDTHRDGPSHPPHLHGWTP